MLSEHLEPRYRKASEYRVISLEVGEHMTPGPRRVFVVARTDYLEAPVAGGFADHGAALWVYELLIDHVAARLAYLDEELFIGLHIDIEEWDCGPDETVWVRQVGSRRL